ncbi:hypothetical protein LPB19_14995 [Marinobacter salinisoli]|uniref:UDP-glucose/GDP-mannose dehydrogenase N-terminal domain-containing protein n=1 Tax=Marinobacter salinisoli TaxID=2769486 RepID=A0ABX7MTN5_9GAMM|nr:hypothetical protein [Marinobacter salinisoli]QSP94466.1 hypothetical protein LPB19_14995 [Marinobacter salinisoli]
MSITKIAITGAGYINPSNTMALAQHDQVFVLDIDSEKVELLNNRKSPIIDAGASSFRANRALNFNAMLDK